MDIATWRNDRRTEFTNRTSNGMPKQMTTQLRKATENPRAVEQDSRAVRYVSPGQTDRIQAILEELNRIHTPETPEESQLIERLAIARAKLYEAEAALDERLRWQKANAEELFERFHHERFTDDLSAWRENPARMTELFGKTWHSAMFLRDLWHAVRDAISNGLGVTYDQGKDMVTALGGDWRADRIDIHRGRIFSLILAFDPNPPALAERWVKASRAGRKDTGTLEDDMDRALWFLASASAPGPARDELESLAENQFQAWSSEAERLRELHLAERARCIEVPPGQPIGNSDDIRATHSCQRDLTRAENRAEKLERRLLMLKKSRLKEDLRSPLPPDCKPSPSAVATAEPPPSATTEPTMRICSDPAETPVHHSLQALARMIELSQAPNQRDIEPAEKPSTGDAAKSTSHTSRPARRPDSHGIAKKVRARTQRTQARRIDRTAARQPDTVSSR